MILDSLTKLFYPSTKKEKVVYNDILSRQGDLFLSLQDNYYNKVAPHLALIEKTSSDNLQSIVEGYENSGEDHLKFKGTYTDNTKDKVKSLEEQYNAALASYIEISKQLAQLDGTNTQAATSLQDQLQKSNNELVDLAQKIYEAIDKTDASQKDANINKKKQQLFSSINKLKEKQKKKKTDKSTGIKYHGEYADNDMRVNYAYYHYIVWLLAVVILISGATMTILNIPYPNIQWPWSIAYVIIILGLLWLMGMAIWTKFWRNL